MDEYTDLDLKKIRVLLTDGLTDQELSTLVFDDPEFRPVYEQFSDKMGKNDKIQHLLEYADRQGQLEDLLAKVKILNPKKFEEIPSDFKSSARLKIECEDFITVTDYVLDAADIRGEASFNFPIRIKGDEQILSKAQVWLDNRELLPKAKTSKEIECALTLKDVAYVNKRGGTVISIEVRIPNQTKPVRKHLDLIKTPWLHLVNINRPDPYVDEDIECSISVFNKSDDFEEFELRASSSLLKIRFDEKSQQETNPQHWSDYLNHDGQWKGEIVRVGPNTLSQDWKYQYKSTEPGLFAIFTYALRRSHRAYVEDHHNWRFSDNHQWHLILVRSKLGKG